MSVGPAASAQQDAYEQHENEYRERVGTGSAGTAAMLGRGDRTIAASVVSIGQRPRPSVAANRAGGTVVTRVGTELGAVARFVTREIHRPQDKTLNGRKA